MAAQITDWVCEGAIAQHPKAFTAEADCKHATHPAQSLPMAPAVLAVCHKVCFRSCIRNRNGVALQVHSCMLRLLVRPQWLCSVAVSCWKGGKRVAMSHVQP